MIKLGETQTLKMLERSSSGIYLTPLEEDASSSKAAWAPAEKEKVLLPNNQVPENIQIGDTLEVFLYKDSEDRPIATTATPYIKLGEIASLKVIEVGKIGAFLDWGLLKDLLLPFKEQTRKVAEGEEVLVTLYLDKSQRLCATMNIYKSLLDESPYQKDDKVIGTVYEPSGNFGVFVAVDNKYSGLIPKKDVFREYIAGEVIEARVTSVREDGKLNLSTREKIPVQMNEDSQFIYDRLIENKGFLPFHDKSDPELIKKEFNLSKNAFKRAIGHLLKEKKIRIEEDGIYQIHG